MLQRLMLIGSLAFLVCMLVVPVGATIQQGFAPELIHLLLSSPRFWECLLNSVNLAIFCSALCICFALPLALLTSRYRLPMQGLIQSITLLPLVLPPFVSAIGLRKLLSRFGPINLLLMHTGLTDNPIDFLGASGLTGVAVVQALHLYPLPYLAITSALNRQDSSLEEAAALLGASPLQRLKAITLPLLTPALVGSGILVFTWSLTDLGTPLVFDYRSLLSVRIFEHADDTSGNPMGHSLVAMMAVLCTLLFAISQRLKARSPILGGTKEGRTISPRPLKGPAKLLASIGVLLFLALATTPHLGVFLLSIAPKWFMTVLPERISFAAYSELFSHPLTGPSIRNSVVLSVASTGLNLTLGLSIAWLLARGSAPGRKLLDLLSMTPLAVPGIVLAFGYLGIFAGTPLDARVNPMPLLILGYTVRRVPFMLRSIDAGFAQCDAALEEAAAIFGAAPPTILQRITAPLLAPQIIAGAILCFCMAMLEVSESLLLATREKYFPISKAMYSLLSRPDGAAIASALGVVTMALLLLGFWSAARLTRRPLAEIFRP